MKNIFLEMQKLLKESGEAQLLVTRFSKDNRGLVSELSRSFEKNKYLKEEETRNILLSGVPKILLKEEYNYFAEPYYNQERLVIYGGGHIALPLVKLGKMLGFYVIVIDDRLQYANQERFLEADMVVCDNFEKGIQTIKPVKSDYHVIITRGHKHDCVCLKELLTYKESVYTGLIGSKKRTAIVINNLVEEGYDRDRLMRICTPIGLPIGSVTIEEIAISIIAQVIQRKRLGEDEQMAINRGDGDDSVIEQLVSSSRPCCLVTIMKTSGSVPRKAGAKMLVFDDTSIMGSIGGGCVEADAIKKAFGMIGSGTYEIMNVSLDDDIALEDGMVCGGNLQLFLEDIPGDIF